MKRIIPLLLVAGCGLTDDSFTLDHPRILAVRATPSHIAAGETAHIDLLAGDASGAVFETDPDTLTADVPVLHTDAGWAITAPPGAPLANLSVSLAIDGQDWPATKQVVLGDHADNPGVTTMQVDGTDEAALTTDAGTKPMLSAISDAADLSYAWYSSVGKLDHARDAVATLDAASPATGMIVLVVRDGAGGVGWATLPAAVR